MTQNPGVSRGRSPVPGGGTHAARGGSKFREKAWLLLTQAGGFSSVEDLGVLLDLPPSTVDGLRDTAIFLKD
jgi:hypothetical protein